MDRIEIENIYDENRMGVARDILRHKGIALVAVGSPACVRSLYLTAEEMGQTDFLFWKALSERDYSLGKNGAAIGACIQEALSYPEVTGVIVYASCMDILTGWDIDQAITDAKNPRNIPIEVLYRGPLAKRRNSPLQRLQKIWDNWKTEVTDVPVQIESREKYRPPKKTRFEEIISQYAVLDCDILLLTPGGCKSCIQCREDTSCQIKNTRFTDISLSTLTTEKLAETILAAFPENRPLILLESMAVKMVGLDMEELGRLLTTKGKKVKW